MPILDGEAKRFQLEAISDSAPTPAVRGRMYLDTSTFSSTIASPKMHDGSQWRKVKTGRTTMRTFTSDTLIDGDDEMIHCDASGGAFTVTLPEGTGRIVGLLVRLTRKDNTFGNLVTIASGGSDTIEDQTSITLATRGESVLLWNIGSQWRIMERTIPSQWQSYIPTGSWSSNTTYTGFWRRAGDSLELDIKVAVTGAPTSASLTVNLPTGLVINTNKMTAPEAGISAIHGSVSIRDSGTENYDGLLRYSSTTAIAVFKDDGDGTVSAVSQTAPMTWANGDYTTIKVVGLPIVGWNGWRS